MKLKTKKYKAILSISILTSLGTSVMMINNYGHIENNTYSSEESTQEISLNLGRDHSSLIDSNGDLWMWGKNNNKQIAKKKKSIINEPVNITQESTNPLYGKTIKAVALGGNHTVAIDSEGNLWTWGYNGNGQLGNGKQGSDPINITEQEENPIYGKTIEQVSATHTYSAAIDSTGDLWMWGDNSKGQLGNGTTTNSSTPINIKEAFNYGLNAENYTIDGITVKYSKNEIKLKADHNTTAIMN